jgi:hypothetical protein
MQIECTLPASNVFELKVADIYELVPLNSNDFGSVLLNVTLVGVPVLPFPLSSVIVLHYSYSFAS